MKKIILSGLLAAVVLLILSVVCLYVTIWALPTMAAQYYEPAVETQAGRYMI